MSKSWDYNRRYKPIQLNAHTRANSKADRRRKQLNEQSRLYGVAVSSLVKRAFGRL